MGSQRGAPIPAAGKHTSRAWGRASPLHKLHQLVFLSWPPSRLCFLLLLDQQDAAQGRSHPGEGGCLGAQLHKKPLLSAPRLLPKAGGSEGAACTTQQPSKPPRGEMTWRSHLLSPGRAPLSTFLMSSTLHRTRNNQQREKQGDLLLISKAL